jgi:hypothetical protein
LELFGERLGERELAPVLFSGEALDEVREKALAFEAQSAVPQVELVEEVRGYNLVKAGERYVAVAKELGPMNLFQERLGERDLPPFLLTASDPEALRQKIAELTRCVVGGGEDS